MIKETEKYSVLNYNENRVSVMVSPDKSYSFDPSIDGNTPCVIPMSLDEIKYANNSGAFKNGMLFFDENHEEELYKELSISNWNDILKNSDIQNIILHPTYEGLSKLISIQDSAIFERVRTVYQKIVVNGTNDISVRVEQIIKSRYRELLNRQIKTSIVLTQKDVPDNTNPLEVNELKAQNKSMQEQIAQMQKMMEQMMKQNSEKKSETKGESKKSPGRPPKKSS